MASPLVGVVMGSKSDWETMRQCCEMLEQLGIAHEKRVLSAHRTPDLLFEWLADIEKRGAKLIIAAAGGAAHLAGVAAAKTMLPVLGVPMQSKSLGGLDSLLSMVQMPAGIPVPTLAIGEAGAKNAAIFAAHVLALNDSQVRERLQQFRRKQADAVRAATLD